MKDARSKSLSLKPTPTKVSKTKSRRSKITQKIKPMAKSSKTNINRRKKTVKGKSVKKKNFQLNQKVSEFC